MRLTPAPCHGALRHVVGRNRTGRGPWSLFGAAAGAHTGDMAEMAAILVAGGLLVAGVEAWYETWRRRVQPPATSRGSPASGSARGARTRTQAPQFLGAGVLSQVVLMARLFGTRNVGGMSIRWRIGLAAIIAATIVGGFLPHGVALRHRHVGYPGGAGTRSSIVRVGDLRRRHLRQGQHGACRSLARGCTRGRRGRGPGRGGGCRLHPAPAWSACSLPVGARDPLFHPPQFS